MALYLVQWDNVKNRYKRGVSAPDFRVGQSNIGQGATSLAVTFPESLANTNYSVTVSWQNTQDPSYQIQPTMISNVTTDGFTVSWVSPTDTSNYKINWIVMRQE